MKSFSPNMDILPKPQKQLWPQLAPIPKLGFTLYGGTAIALRLGHRHSIDFDFFSKSSLDKKKLKLQLPFLINATTIQEEANTLVVLVPVENKTVKVSFFGTINFGRIGEHEITTDGVLKVASLEDLLATKLKVILQRVESKDYIDIATIIKSGINLAVGLTGASLLFGKDFQPSESLKALVYFHGGDLDILDTPTKEIIVSAVRNVNRLPELKLAAKNI